MTARRRIHVLFEQSPQTLTAQCSGHIRLLRPLMHPTVADRVDVSASRHFDGGRYDAVIVERLWRPGVTLAAIEALLDAIRRSGAQLVYAQDDNIYDLPGATWLTEEHRTIMKRLQADAAGVLTSTEPLRERLSQYAHRRIVVVPNYLDERLIASSPLARVGDEQRLVVGYMGTRSHDEDLPILLPALHAAHARFGARLEIQIVGAMAHAETALRFAGLPVRVLGPRSQDADYPLFFSWFTGAIRWDVGLAPLPANPYNVCKSDIKWLDYTAIGAAGLFSRLDPYAPIRDGELGLVVDNDADSWCAGLDRLLGDAALRQRIVRQSRAQLFANRTLRQHAARTVRALDELLG